jgi:hypothetical protein
MTIKTSGPISLLDIFNEYGGSGPTSIGNYYRGGIRVNGAVAPSGSAFITPPKGSASGVQIPTGGMIQFSEFYGTTANVYPAAGTILQNGVCSGTTLGNIVADGNGGSYFSPTQYNSPTCGYVPPFPAELVQNGLYASAGSPSTTALARIYLYPDGTWVANGTNNPQQTGRWLTASNGSDYEIMWQSDNTTNTYPQISIGADLNGTYLGEGTWTPLSQSIIAHVQDATGTEDGSGESFAEAGFYYTIRQINNQANTVTFHVDMYADGQCFALGTMLRTPYGDRTVESLIAGDQLISFAEATMIDEDTDGWRDWKIKSLDGIDTNASAYVKGVKRFSLNESVKINGIHSTLSHTCFVFDGEDYGWKLAKDITMQDSFVDAELNLVPITSIEQITEPTTFIAINAETLDTLQVKYNDTYVLTHNRSA